MSDPTGEHLEFERFRTVERLCREARERAEKGDRSAALVTYLEAWEALPEPKESWEASTEILSAVGDLMRTGGDLSRALEVLERGKPGTAG